VHCAGIFEYFKTIMFYQNKKLQPFAGLVLRYGAKAKKQCET
jgi:hypothetical protein